MYEFKVKYNEDSIYTLTSNPNYTLYKIEGLEPPQASVNTSANATSDGSTVNSIKVPQRNLVLYMTIEGDVETNRINLYKYFPYKRNIELYYKNNTRNVFIEGYVESINVGHFDEKQIAQISIICPQPYFKAIDDVVNYFSEVSKLFEFPFSISKSGVEFSAISTNIRKSIINAGEVESGAIIELNAIGTVVNPVIYDVFKRTHLRLNFTMEINDKITINTYQGKKSITLTRDGVTTNAMGYMTPDSTWLTLDVGDNVYAYESDSGNANLQITFTTSALYGGV
jgi:hypothetical protein